MDQYEIDKLLKQIVELQQEISATKKYGLVWDKENTKEDVVSNCENNMPVLSFENGAIRNGDINNILIEGDNFHALTALKMIGSSFVDIVYIDPPYNTGNKDFNYNDTFVGQDDSYRHSKWLNSISKRLALAKGLMKETGAIFISINDIESANLRLLCDSIFGEDNFLAQFVRCTSGGKQDSSAFAIKHEYLMAYAKKKNLFVAGKITKEKSEKEYPLKDEQTGRIYKLQLLRKWGDKDRREDRPNLFYPIYVSPNENTISLKPMNYKDEISFTPKRPNGTDGRWRWQTSKMNEAIENNDVAFTFKKGQLELYEKIYYEEGKDSKTPYSTIIEDNWQSGTDDLKQIFKEKVFEYAKPVEYIKYILGLIDAPNAVVLDFYAGSGTTGQAVLELNKEEGGNRRFILCTNNENNICTDVTYPRLKTVITGVRQDGSRYSGGIPSNLYCFKTGFVEDLKNSDQAKYNLAEKVDSLLCIAEDIFDEKKRNDYSSHFVSSDKKRHLFIYNDYFNKEKFDEFKERVIKAEGEKVVYVFSFDNNLDESLFDDKSINVKPIPEKIYEIYKEIAESIKRGE